MLIAMGGAPVPGPRHLHWPLAGAYCWEVSQLAVQESCLPFPQQTVTSSSARPVPMQTYCHLSSRVDRKCEGLHEWEGVPVLPHPVCPPEHPIPAFIPPPGQGCRS